MAAEDENTSVEPQQDEMDSSLNHELAKLLNRNSQENASNTPDFILAQFMLDCLAAYNRAQAERATWHGAGVITDGR